MMTLPTMAEWLASDEAERGELLDTLVDTLGGPWESEGAELLREDVSSPFVFVPGGAFRPGFSADEERVYRGWIENARNGARHPDAPATLEMLEYGLRELLDRCAVRDPVTIEPLLLAKYPLIRTADRDAWCRDRGLRLPTDSEWEWAARAGTTTLTWQGNAPPSDETMTRFDVTEDPYPNPLGLLGIGWKTEVCFGERSPNEASRTYRGGGQECAPWQGTGELVYLLSAYRRLRPDSGSDYVRVALPLSGAGNAA